MMKQKRQYKGLKLHDGQLRILKHIKSKVDAKYITIKCSRQWGKTLFAIQLLLFHSINEKSTIGWFSPYISQCKKVMRQIVDAIRMSGLINDYNQTDRIITLINGSKIYFFGVDNDDAIRGNTFDYVICDEAAFFPKDVFDEVIRPTLLVKGKKCYIISTPKGKSNWFYKYYIQDGIKYTSVEGNYLENKYVPLDEIEAAKQTLPQHIFRQEFLGEFLDSEFQVFQNVENVSVLKSWAKPTKNNYAGLDLGRKNDYTVLTILNEHGEVVEIYRTQDKLWLNQINQIVQRLKKYNAYCYVDATGVGDAIFEQIKKEYKSVYPFVITGSGEESKQNLIEKLIISIQNSKLKLPTKELYEDLHNEMSAFECIYTLSSRSLKYQAIQGYHDDIILSLALCNICWLKKKLVNSNIVFYV
jgi:phage FluMu gp28-like protein